MKNTRNRNLAYGVCAFALFGLGHSPLAMSAEEAAEVTEFEEIIVSGSRIKRSGVTSPTPVTVIGAEDISLSGKLSLGDFLTELPALGSTFTTANSNRFIGTVGGSFLDLRRMGTGRTLVLVDGRRHVASSPGSTNVDINTIPSDLVERVDVVTGGASAIYGADAVTGVVNFIMKDDFEGLTAKAQYGHVGEGGHYSYFTSVTGGGNFADDRGNAVLSVEWTKQNQFDRNERQYYRDNWRRVTNPKSASGKDGIPDRIYIKNAGNYFYSYGGRFTVDGTPYLFNKDGSHKKQNLGTRFGTSCQNCDFITATDWGILQPEMSRLAVTGKVRYDITEDLEFFVEGKFVNTQAMGQSSGSFDTSRSGLVIKRENPFVSSALGSLMDANSLTSVTLSRIHNDLGLRREDNDRQTSRIVLGLKGELTEGWDWEASYTYGKTSRTLIGKNTRVNSRFYAAVDAVTVGGKTVCRSTITDKTNPLYDAKYANNPLLSGCVPLDVMGEGRGSKKAIDWVMADVTRKDKIEQQVFNAFVSGDAFELPAGSIQVAAGVEWRKERSSQKPAELDQMGLTFGNALATVKGEYDVKEIFGEVTVPLLNDVAFAQNLSLDAAVRYADYNTSGGNTTWKLGGNWQPIEDFRMRATYGKAVRAPNIGELFAPLGQNFYSSYDPCYQEEIDSITDSAAKQKRITNCIATGVPNAATRKQLDTSSIPGQSGGNPKLNPEKSTSWTVGAIFTPTFVEGLTVTVDYWNISLQNAISAVSAKDIKDKCVDADSVDNIYCKLTTRGGAAVNYRYTNLIQTDQNIAALKASGIDFEVNYRLGDLLAESDNFDIRLTGTYLINKDEYPYQDDPSNKDEEAGELGDPKWLMNLKTTYYTGDWTISHTLRFIDSMYLRELSEKKTAPEYQSPSYTGVKFYSNMQVRYNIIENTEVYVGIDNVFATKPGGFQTGTGGDSGIYDSRGRFFYAGVTTKF